MREVSAAYISMMQGREVHSRIEVVISSATDSITLHDRDIVKDSLSINWRSGNNKEFSLGTCYATSISFTALKSVEIEEAIAGATDLKVQPVLYYDVGNGNEQAFQLGTFFCDEPQWHTRTTAYECYDAMLAFDIAVESRFSGLPYNVLAFICSQCGIELGTTAADISAMCNSAQTVVIDPTQVQTHRDALSYVSIVLGAYCVIGDDGKLYVRRFHKEPDLTLARGRRKKTVFAGYRTEFAGIKCRFLAEQNFYPYEYTEPDKIGLVLDVGDLPIIEDNERTKQAILKNIYDDVLADCIYYPCEIEMVGDPCIEVGDMIRTQDREGYMKNLLLTSVTYTWHGTSQIISEGGNPKQGRVATQAKRAAQRTEQMAASNTIVTATYKNANEITLDSVNKEEITSLRFTTNKDLTAIFGAEIPVYSTGEGYVEIAYSNNGIEADVVRAQVHAGYNLITLVNHLHYDANMVVLLQLKARAEALDSGTAPTVTIAPDNIRSYIFAQGMETEAPWDGIITISEDIGYVLSKMALYGLTENVSISSQDPAERLLSEIVNALHTQMNTRAISETAKIELIYGDQILRMGMGHRAGMGRMLAPYTI